MRIRTVHRVVAAGLLAVLLAGCTAANDGPLKGGVIGAASGGVIGGAAGRSPAA